MKITFPLICASLAISISLSACVSNPPSAPVAQAAAPAAAPAAASAPAGKSVKSIDGSYEGEVFGSVRPGSKFSALRIGMSMNDVQEKLGRAPDRLHTHETGKRWIPFYFGNDVRRMQVLYKGEGCLAFTDGNVWGAAGGDLVAIHHDASGACYKP